MKDVVLPTPEALRQRIDDLRKSRGFLLPHHGAMAAAVPDLHDAYFAMYRALTLNERHLTPFEKEFVWLAVLIAVEEGIGTHHLDLFAKAGGTQRQAEAVGRLVGYAHAADTLGFIGAQWQKYLPDIDADAAYRTGFDALCAGLDAPSGLVEMALAAANAAVGRTRGVRLHVEGAYRRAVPEAKLVEALSLIIWPAGVNHFLDACAVWHDLMASGAVTPSPLFQVWAETPRQGGFDDADPQR